jgi:hypothetical protein
MKFLIMNLSQVCIRFLSTLLAVSQVQILTYINVCRSSSKMSGFIRL